MKGVIYGIFHNERCLYIGSTNNFKVRKSNHIHDSKIHKRKVYEYINCLKQGWDDIEFKILCEREYQTKKERYEEERIFFDLYKGEILNYHLPFKTFDEIINQRKTYYEKNKSKLLERAKQHYNKNKEQVKERNLERYYENKERYLEKSKECHCKNMENYKQYQKKYRETHKQYFIEYGKKYRENKKSNVLKNTN